MHKTHGPDCNRTSLDETSYDAEIYSDYDDIIAATALIRT